MSLYSIIASVSWEKLDLKMYSCVIMLILIVCALIEFRQTFTMTCCDLQIRGRIHSKGY